MKVQITCPVPEHNLRAGLVYDLPEDIAKDVLDRECGFDFIGEDIPVTAVSDQHPVSIEVDKPKRKSKQ